MWLAILNDTNQLHLVVLRDVTLHKLLDQIKQYTIANSVKAIRITYDKRKEMY